MGTAIETYTTHNPNQSAQSAFDELSEEATQTYGHQEGYSGQINCTHLGSVDQKLHTEAEAAAAGEDADMWKGDTAAFRLAETKIIKRSRTVIVWVNQGAEKYEILRAASAKLELVDGQRLADEAIERLGKTKSVANKGATGMGHEGSSPKTTTGVGVFTRHGFNQQRASNVLSNITEARKWAKSQSGDFIFLKGAFDSNNNLVLETMESRHLEQVKVRATLETTVATEKPGGWFFYAKCPC